MAPLTPRRQQEHSHPRPRCCPHHRHSKRRRCCRRLRRRAAATSPRRSPCAPRNTRCHRERCPVPLKCRMQLDARRRSIRLLDRPGRVCFHRSNRWWSTRSESRSRPVSPDSLCKALWRTASVHVRLLKHAPASRRRGDVRRRRRRQRPSMRAIPAQIDVGPRFESTHLTA